MALAFGKLLWRRCNDFLSGYAQPQAQRRYWRRGQDTALPVPGTIEHRNYLSVGPSVASTSFNSGKQGIAPTSWRSQFRVRPLRKTATGLYTVHLIIMITLRTTSGGRSLMWRG